MISVKTLPINAWQKRFAFLPVTSTEQIDQTSVKQTKIWFDAYWERISINKSDRSLKTTILTESDYRKLWVMETLPHIAARSPLVNDIEKEFSILGEDFLNYVDGKTDGREEFAGIFPVLERLDYLFKEYLESGLIGEAVMVKHSGQDYKAFEYSYLLRILESVQLKDGFTHTEVLDALLTTRQFREGANFKHRADYLTNLISNSLINLVDMRKAGRRLVEILNAKNKTVEVSVELTNNVED